eukprot:TRINITY_DN9248_c0_g1_i4.p1 TRINITY_DN9248_c0_g1~~TRINITY_DN9248_c0_g1_i4.p1  ORF type:complete len:230 (-),score=44.03 TRINITY_DN9248_c0_g1_i4:8-697(-)
MCIRDRSTGERRRTTHPGSSMRAVATAVRQALRPGTAAMTRTFHHDVPLCLPRNSDFVEDRRTYKQQMSELRKKFQAEIADNLSQRAQEDAAAAEEARAKALERRVAKAEAGGIARAANREMHAEDRVLRQERIRKGQKQYSKQLKFAKGMRKTALEQQDKSSSRWIYSEEQIERAITEETMRPYFPSFVWRPMDTRHFPGHRAHCCLLYTSDAADEEDSVDLGGRGII